MLLGYTEHRSGGEVCAGDEDNPWPSYEDEYVHFSPTWVYASRDHAPYLVEQFDVTGRVKPGDKVHLVIVRYFDGCTFGRTCGLWKIAGAFASEADAKALEKSILDRTYDGYRPWDGYFSGFESCGVHTFIVQP